MNERIKELKNIICEEIDNQRDEFINISTYIWENPEIGYEEYKAVEILTKKLEEEGFTIEKNVANMDTAFVAIKDSGKEGPRIGIVSEYDALPEIDHACGHNLFSVASIGAAIGLSKTINEIGGSIKVLGSPAEEGTVPNAGGKIFMVEEGLFDDVDIAMICHAEGRTIIERQLVASGVVRAIFTGKAAHAGGSPEMGINALSAAISTINNINLMRQHFVNNVVVNPIITEGGIGMNTIPDRAVVEMSVRAETRETLKHIIEIINNCIKGGAIATGCTYELDHPKETYENLISNHNLALAFKENLDLMDIPSTPSERTNYGWDIGNVSHVCPTIAPYIKIGDESLVGHTDEFREASRSESGFDGMIVAAKAMALTSLDFIVDNELRERVISEFNKDK